MSAMLFAACGDQMSNNKNTNEMTELNLTQQWDNRLNLRVFRR